MPEAGVDLTLTGFRHSVYTRSVRIALAEKGVAYSYVECDPFDPTNALSLMQSHPFGRVPVLHHDGFRVYEVAAILGYVDACFAGIGLTPGDAQAAARMRQVIAIADNYVYWPLVRQAFSHGHYRPLVGEEGDPAALQKGLTEAPRVLDALEEIAAEGLVLRGDAICLASCHLFPMLDYFALLPEGREMLMQRDALAAWLHGMGRRPSALATRPDLSDEETPE
ncbi:MULTISPECIES: glutathione S-transferase family protein [unclassified Roseovarius]|uniref:glutathione S-transferase family protein n=1 Tax=unclassified Roseovarius TaxID=2614913 RepID=UPI00273F5382|nr:MULTISPECIES: glutathione S-transferase family protein [unclassified Roseovarius]